MKTDFAKQNPSTQNWIASLNAREDGRTDFAKQNPSLREATFGSDEAVQHLPSSREATEGSDEATPTGGQTIQSTCFCEFTRTKVWIASSFRPASFLAKTIGFANRLCERLAKQSRPILLSLRGMERSGMTKQSRKFSKYKPACRQAG